MPRQPKTYQFDLFSSLHVPETASTPRRQTLPVETRQTLMSLMVRLLLDRVPDCKETHDDL